MRTTSSSTGWRCWWPFALLCAIAASRWIFVDSLPEMSSTLRTEALGCGIAALGAGGVGIANKRERARAPDALKLAVIGFGLLAVPALGSALSGAAGESFNRTVALCLVPVIVLVWNGIRADAEARMSIWPGLTGLAAAMLMFPLVAPAGVWGCLGLLAPPAAVSAAIVLASREDLQRGNIATMFAGGAAGLALMECARMLSAPSFSQSTHWQGVVVDVAEAWLTLLSARNLNSLCYASRYFVVPLITILEGALLFRERGSLRLWAGVVLMLGASLTLWSRTLPESEERLRLS